MVAEISRGPQFFGMFDPDPHQFKGRTEKFSLEGPGRGSVWGGGSLLPRGQGSGEGQCPSSENVLLLFRWKWCILVHLYVLSLLKVKTSQPQPVTTAST